MERGHGARDRIPCEVMRLHGRVAALIEIPAQAQPAPQLKLRKKPPHKLRRHPIPALLPPIISNVIIVPLVLKFAYKVSEAYLFTVCTVGAGEIISVGILGFILYSALKKRLPHVLVGYLKN